VGARHGFQTPVL